MACGRVVPPARLVAVLLLALGVLAGCGGQDAASLATVKTYQPIPAQPLGPAAGAVTETDGTSWRYDSSPSSQITLLYFGYTSCPDVCPTTMADLAAALRRVPASVRKHIQVQFVSTDPARDTSAQIRSWLAGFDPGFRGGRAPIGEVISSARSYGVGIAAPRKTKGDYQVTHGAQLLVLRPGGAEVGYFQELAGAHAYATALPLLVRKYAGAA